LKHLENIWIGQKVAVLAVDQAAPFRTAVFGNKTRMDGLVKNAAHSSSASGDTLGG
jgi:putative protein kinase ArgK-like GTPase of G3E family